MQLKELRTMRGYSQKQISDQLGITISAYSRYENEIREPDIKTLIQLANIFGVSVGVVVGSEPLPCREPVEEKEKVQAEAPFTKEQLAYLEQWKKDLTREVSDAILEDTSSSGVDLGA